MLCIVATDGREVFAGNCDRRSQTNFNYGMSQVTWGGCPTDRSYKFFNSPFECPYLGRYRSNPDQTFTVEKLRVAAFQRCPICRNPIDIGRDTDGTNPRSEFRRAGSGPDGGPPGGGRHRVDDRPKFRRRLCLDRISADIDRIWTNRAPLKSGDSQLF